MQIILLPARRGELILGLQVAQELGQRGFIVLRQIRRPVIEDDKSIGIGAVIDMASDGLPALQLRRLHQAVTREDGAVGSDHHRLLLAVYAQALPQNSELVLWMAAVVSGVGKQVADGPPLNGQVKVRVRLAFSRFSLL